MYKFIALGLMSALLQQAPAAETRVVEYLKANVKPGQPVVFSDLYNRVFKTPEEQKVLEKLYNTFFKIPMFLVQFQTSAKRVPTLKEISEQFNFRVPGEADVILRIMESDPRVPKFIERDRRTGEIRKIDIATIKASPQFSQVVERTMSGFEKRPAPSFSIAAYDGKAVTSQQFRGQPHLVYFWFTNCPPCVKTSPILAELYTKYSQRGFKVIAANADKALELPYDDKTRGEYAKKYGFNFTLAHMSPAMQQSYGNISVFPTMFFVDKSGMVVKQFVNFQERTTLEAAIQQILK